MSDLDKLFKKKLEQRSFEFKDAYWQAAEQLIEAQEGKRRRRLGWWWTTGLMFLLGLVSSIYYYSQVDQAQIVNAEYTEDLVKTKSTEAKENASIAVAEDQVVDLNASGRVDEKLERRYSENDPSSTTSTNQNEAVKSGSGYVAETRRSDIIGASTRVNNKNNKVPEKPEALINNTSNAIAPAKANTLIVESDTQEKTSEQSYEKSIPKIETPTPISKSEEIALTATLNLLETRGLEQLEHVTEAAKMDMIVETFAPKIWSLGLNLSTMYNLSKDYSGYSGLGLGASINYRVNQHWSVQSGLGYSVRRPENISLTRGSSDPDNIINQAQDELAGGFISTTNYYNFGLIQVNEIVNIDQFHFIELPLSVQYQLGRHALSLGWQLNYLSGIYGNQYLQTAQANINPNTNTPEVVELLTPESGAKGWLDKSRYNKWSSELSMNYGFLLDRRWRVNLGAHFQLFDNGLVNTGDVASNLNNRAASIPKSNRLYFRLGMQYTIGK